MRFVLVPGLVGLALARCRLGVPLLDRLFRPRGFGRRCGSALGLFLLAATLGFQLQRTLTVLLGQRLLLGQIAPAGFLQLAQRIQPLGFQRIQRRGLRLLVRRLRG